MTKSKAISAGFWYTIGNILIKGINFLTVPLFSRILTTEEFGLYNTFIAYDSILCIVMSLALYMSIQSANIEFKNKIDEYTSSITLVYILFAFLLFGIVFLFGDWLAVVFDFPKLILYMLILYSFGSGIISLYNQRVSLDYDYKKYLLVVFLNSIGNIVLSLIFIFTVFNDNKAFGRIIGVTLSMFGLSIILLSYIYRRAKLKLNKEYISFGIRYSIPIVPHGLSQVVLSQFDRIMISKLVNNDATGIYSLAGNIKLILTIITNSLSSVWRTWFYEHIGTNDTKNIQNKATLLTAGFAMLSVGMISISPEIIMFLGGKEYIMGKYVAIPMIVDAFILFLYNIIIPAEYYKKRTTFIMLGTLFAAVLDVITNYIFILKYGYVAAAYTTLFAYICYLILHIIISYRLVRFFIVPIQKLIWLGALVFLSCGLSLLFIEHIIKRYFMGVLILTIFSLTLFKEYKDSRKLIENTK